MKKSFRSRMTPGTVEKIRLSTNNGLIGYKIVKFQLINKNPHAVDAALVAKVFTTGTTETGAERTATATVNFTDPTLVAVAAYEDKASSNYPTHETILFDNVTFNQDIYISMADADSSTEPGNYYLELEQVKLSKDEATVATLKDMRAGPDTNFGS
jgi:hypothetical protein